MVVPSPPSLLMSAPALPSSARAPPVGGIVLGATLSCVEVSAIGVPPGSAGFFASRSPVYEDLLESLYSARLHPTGSAAATSIERTGSLRMITSEWEYAGEARRTCRELSKFVA